MKLQRNVEVAVLSAAVLMWAVLQPSPATAAEQEVKMVVTAAMVSSKGMRVYDDIATYLSKKTGVKFKVVSGLSSYGEADRLLAEGRIQVGYVCGLPYVHEKAKGTYDLIAVPVMAMKKGAYPDARGYESFPGKYYSYTIVRKDSPIKTWADLKGKTYAYNDPGSNSGFNLPRAKLTSLGAKSFEEYFSKVIRSGDHEESIRLVANGTVDASSVDSLVLDYDRSIKDAAAMNVRIIEHLGPAGIPPVVFSAKADQSLKKPLQDALLSMHLDPDGKKLLAKGLLLRFDPPSDKNYDDIRAFEKAATDVGFVAPKK